MKKLPLIFFVFLSFFVLGQTTEKVRYEKLIKSCEKLTLTKPDSAEKLAREAYISAKNLNCQKCLAEADYLLAEIFVIKNKYTEAGEKYINSLQIYNEINDLQEYLKICNRISWLYILKSEYGEAVSYANKVINNINANEGQIALAYNNLASAYTYIGNYPEAIKIYLKALEIHEKTGYEQGIAYTLNNIAAIYVNQKNYDNALIYFFKTKIILEKIRDYKQIPNLLNNIGSVYSLKGNTDSALFYRQKAFKISISQSNVEEIPRIASNLAYYYLSTNDFENFLKYIEISISYYTKSGNKTGLSYCYTIYSDYYKKKNDIEKAIKYSELSLKYAELSNSKPQKKDAYLQLSNLYFEKNSYLEAYNNLSLYNKLYDSIFNIERLKIVENITMVYETEKKEDKIRILEVNEKIKDVELKRNRLIITILIIGSSVFIILLSVLIVFYRNTKAAYNILVEKNIEQVSGNFNLKNSSENSKTESQPELTEKEIAISENLEYLLEKENIYTDENLNLDDLAKKLNTNRAVLSKIINQKYDCNFNNFINRYRINQVCKMLISGKNADLTIEGIAQNVGFNSRSTFNSAFKKIVGVTPSFYINSLKNKA